MRAALVITIGASYWQIFLDVLHRKALRVSTIDSLAGVLGALQEFFNLTILRASPLLVALAVLSWLMLFIAIVPPVTLTISPLNWTNQFNTTWHTPDFSNVAAFSIMNNETSGFEDSKRQSSLSMAPTYSGPSRHLVRLLTATAYNGQLPILPKPAENSSYSQNWIGPSIKCQPIRASILSLFKPAMGGFDPRHPVQETENGFHYLSWTPSSAKNSTVPWEKDSIHKDTSKSGGVGAMHKDGGCLGHINGGPAIVFVAARANISTSDWTVLNCSLYNASYTIRFAFAADTQDVSVSSIQDLNPVGPIDPSADVSTSRRGWTINATSALISYEMMMEVLGNTLCGAVWSEKEPQAGVVRPTILNIDRTRVLETLIANTAELWPLYAKGTDVTGEGGSIEKPPANPPTLATAIESLFQNMTITLLSQPRYLKDQTEPITVISRTSRNIYVYSPTRLWLAYGLGLGLTFVVAAVGCWNVFSANASYSNRFSTVLRTTRGLELDALVEKSHRNGEDPVPRAIKRAQLSIVEGLNTDAVRDKAGEGAGRSLLEG